MLRWYVEAWTTATVGCDTRVQEYKAILQWLCVLYLARPLCYLVQQQTICSSRLVFPSHFSDWSQGLVWWWTLHRNAWVHNRHNSHRNCGRILDQLKWRGVWRASRWSSFVCSFLSVLSVVCVASGDRMVNELQRIWKDEVGVRFKVHLPATTHTENLSRYQVSGPKWNRRFPSTRYEALHRDFREMTIFWYEKPQETRLLGRCNVGV
jgi:hypothetical protein